MRIYGHAPTRQHLLDMDEAFKAQGHYVKEWLGGSGIDPFIMPGRDAYTDEDGNDHPAAGDSSKHYAAVILHSVPLESVLGYAAQAGITIFHDPIEHADGIQEVQEVLRARWA